jgi:hypothetical protein
MEYETIHFAFDISMTPHEFSLIYHELRFKAELPKRAGQSFQDFFEQIMQKVDPYFQMIKPMGKAGDWKADGYSPATGTVYQCYAPEKLTVAKGAKKINEDLTGAQKRWKRKMRRWVFVWSSVDGLPAEVAALLAELRAKHRKLAQEDMGPEGLWKLVGKLSLHDRISLFGAVPEISSATETTAVEIQMLLNHLSASPLVSLEENDLALTAIADKLQRNRLSIALTAMLKPAIPVAKLVGKFVTGMPDPNFSRIIAARLAEKYNELTASVSDPDAIFAGLVDYLLAGPLNGRLYWAAMGIVAYYFELCDIFER